MTLLFRQRNGLFTADGRQFTTHEEQSECYQYGCVVHSPSSTHMDGWHLNWRSDIGQMERVCPHGIGHPDPDQAFYNIRTGNIYDNIHGCDGCCETGEWN